MLRFAPRKPTYALRVVIIEDVIDQMIAASTDPDSETGGILLGSYMDGGMVIHVAMASSPPCDSSAGLDWFERGKNGLVELLREQWELPQRRYYVGEWHFHPIGRADPSPQDRHQMAEISRDPNYRCERPLLIIASPATLRRRTARVFMASETGELQAFEQDS